MNCVTRIRSPSGKFPEYKHYPLLHPSLSFSFFSTYLLLPAHFGSTFLVDDFIQCFPKPKLGFVLTDPVKGAPRAGSASYDTVKTEQNRDLSMENLAGPSSASNRSGGRGALKVTGHPHTSRVCSHPVPVLHTY